MIRVIGQRFVKIQLWLIACPKSLIRRYSCLRKKIEVWVIRQNPQGQLVNSKPCELCRIYLRLFNVKNVYYSTEEGKIIKESVENLNCRHCLGYSRYLSYIRNKNSPPPPDYRMEKKKKL